MNSAEAINNRIFDLLLKEQKSQKELAESISATTSTVTAWKTRKSDIPSSYIPKIASFFNVTIAYLLTGSDEAKKSPAAAISDDEAKVLKYYNRLSEEGRDYIKGEMIRVYDKESDSNLENGRRVARGS